MAELDKVEFKLTVLPTDVWKVPNLVGGAKPLPRKVCFYDTPKLALAKKKLVVRARVTDGEADSTVKLRPVPRIVPPPWSDTEDVEIELDIVGTRETPSAKLDDKPKPAKIDQVKLSKLFSKAQKTLIAPALPKGTKLDDLQVLGPINALKWELEPNGFPYELAVEEWTIIGGPHFIELSFKVDRDDTKQARKAWNALLDDHGFSREHPQDAKTAVVLNYFAEKL